MTTDDSMDDDVFEVTEDYTANNSTRLKVQQNAANHRENTPSPTGYRGYKPPAEVLKLAEGDVIEDSEIQVHKVTTKLMQATLAIII